MSGQGKPENIFLVDKASNRPIPLLTTLFDVTISMGFADIVFHQVYENRNDNPLETLFMMPYSDSFALNKIIVDFTLENGTIKTLET